MEQIIDKSEWEDCPNCDNEGCYGIEDGEDVEPVQCEFCYTNPKSVFYQKNKLYEKGESDD